jgi:hypothetical protein
MLKEDREMEKMLLEIYERGDRQQPLATLPASNHSRDSPSIDRAFKWRIIPKSKEPAPSAFHLTS